MSVHVYKKDFLCAFISKQIKSVKKIIKNFKNRQNQFFFENFPQNFQKLISGPARLSGTKE